MIETKELINRIKPDTNLDEFFDEYQEEFHNITGKELLNEYLAKYELRVSEVSKASGQGDYVYKVFNGERKASRDILICIAIGMGLKLNETQLVLRLYKFATLDPRDKRDSLVIFGINSEYSIEKMNNLLFEKNETML